MGDIVVHEIDGKKFNLKFSKTSLFRAEELSGRSVQTMEIFKVQSMKNQACLLLAALSHENKKMTFENALRKLPTSDEEIEALQTALLKAYYVHQGMSLEEAEKKIAQLLGEDVGQNEQSESESEEDSGY